MTIGSMIRQGFHYAIRCRSLWLFGFVVGVASSGGSSGGGSGGGGGADEAVAAAGAAGVGLGFGLTDIALILVGIAVLAIAALIVRCVSEGALIEGVARTHQGGTVTTLEGLKAGWAHWGVLLRLMLLYGLAIVGSLAVLIGPCVLALRLLGPAWAITLGVPAILIAVPWFITLHLVQAFAARIAVVENRQAIDALRKARLFLHGRLAHGLKLIVATLAGTLVFALAGIAAVVPIVLAAVALIPSMGALPAFMTAGIVLVPIGFVIFAMLGTFRSSLWTIGYVAEVRA